MHVLETALKVALIVKLGKVTTTSLAIALGLITGMAIVGLIRGENFSKGATS